MTNTKTKYILSSAAVIALGFASAFGAINIINNASEKALALENLPHCTNIKQYDRWANFDEHTIISSPVNITEDTIASYVVPDQEERCKVEINLNGYTVSEAYQHHASTRSALIVGSNVVTVVNGDGGKFDIGSPEDPGMVCDPPSYITNPDGSVTEEPGVCHVEHYPENVGGMPTKGIIVNQNSELYLNNITIESEGKSVYAYTGSKVEANNVTTNKGIWNNGGELTINSGNYTVVSTVSEGKTIINGGSFNNIEAETGTSTTINDGTVSSYVRSYTQLYESSSALPPSYYNSSKTNDITINDGTYDGVQFLSPATINGGSFNDASFSYKSYVTQQDENGNVVLPAGVNVVINGGDFSNSDINIPATVSGGSFEDTTFNNSTDITDGSFKNTEFKGATSISEGNYESSSFTNDDSIITGGTFRATEIPSTVEVSGGSFDNIPAAVSIADDKKVIENENGSYSVVDESAPGEEPIRQCEIRIYTDENTYTTYTGVITLTEDTVASYEIDDQSDICRFTINLNGKKLTSVDNKETINVGSNVSAKINGENGTIEQSNTTNPDAGTNTPAPAAIVINDEGAASIRDVTIETNSENNPGISNSGKTTLNNVNAGENTNIENNDGGELTVNSGNYSNITSTDSGNVTINGGKVDEVVSNNNSEVTINDGDFNNSNISSTESNPATGETTPATDSGNVTINGGDFNNANINSQTNINGGNFEGTNINNEANISGGNFEDANINAPANISGGNFEGTTAPAGSEVTGGTFDTLPDENSLPDDAEVIENENGTFEIRTRTNAPDDNTEPSTDANTVAVPDTGGFSASEKGGKQVFIGAVIAFESAFLAICGYILFRLRKYYNVNFRRK